MTVPVMVRAWLDMPKKGAAWRKRQILQFEGETLLLFLADELPGWKCTSRTARWVYENLPIDSEFRSRAIDMIRWGQAPFAIPYLWRELEKWKSDEFGDWVVIALCRGICDSSEIPRFIDLYRDESAHPVTRGSALYAIANRLWEGEDIPNLAEVRAVCQQGLQDPHPYARRGAIWMASKLGGFTKELEALVNDEESWEGYTVASEARYTLESQGDTA